MNNSYSPWSIGQVPILLRGEAEPISHWIHRWDAKRLVLHLVVILLGTGVFGATVGCWRSPLQALYVTIKLPLVLLLTTLGTALLNGMLAPLLGLNLRFRQSLLAILMSFTIAALILGACSPLIAFLVWNTPPMGSAGSADAHGVILLTLVAVIAFAGIAANLRLMQLLRELSGNSSVARKILFSWLAGNLLLGSQLSWILRPFVGSPGSPVEFLRADAFDGNFYEAVFRTMRALLFS